MNSDKSRVKETTTQHTPGPWRVGDAGATVFGPPSSNPSPITVARVTNRENARLIAAAPEMLEALRFALDNGDDYEAEKRCRAAISKATGGPQ